MHEKDHRAALSFMESFLEDTAKGKGESEAEKRIRMERIAADAEATRYLSEMDCPATVREFGRRHNIENFAEFTWLAGFQQGWRMACARADKKEHNP